MIDQQELWIDTRLNQEEMDFLWGCISEEKKERFSKELAGCTMKAIIKDKDNWFFN